MKTRLPVLVCGAALTAFASAGLSHEDQDQEYREHGAHVHGLGTLDVAQQGPEIHLRLETPAANIVGFEHAPQRDVERAALEKAAAALKDGPALFQLSEAARCALAEVRVESPLLGLAGEAEGHGHDHEGAAASGGDAGDHNHAHAAERHVDIAAEYQFLCAQPAELREIRVTLFERFPATGRLQVQVTTDRGQAGAELTPANPVLKL